MIVIARECIENFQCIFFQTCFFKSPTQKIYLKLVLKFKPTGQSFYTQCRHLTPGQIDWILTFVKFLFKLRGFCVSIICLWRLCLVICFETQRKLVFKKKEHGKRGRKVYRQNILWILRKRGRNGENVCLRAKVSHHSWFWSHLRSENKSASYPGSF